MKRIVAIVLVGAMAALALAPVAWIAFLTIYVETVTVRRGEGGGEGYRSARVREVTPVGPREIRLRVDEDVPVLVVLAPGAGEGYRPGDEIHFSPPPDVLKHEPDAPVTLYREEPKARMVLWARGVLEEVGPREARIDAEALTDLMVSPESLAGLDLKPGARVRFRPERTFSLAHYRALAAEVGPFLKGLGRWASLGKPDFPRRLGLLFHTLLVSVLAAVLATVLGAGYAVLASKFETPGRGVLSWVYIAPLIIPPYISAIAWTLMLGEQGTFTKAIQKALGRETALFTIYGIPGSVLVLALSFFPIVTLLAQAGLRSVHREQEEAALLAGGRWRTLFGVTLRQASPYLLSGAVFVFLFALSSSGAPALLRLQLYSSQVLVAFQTDLSGAEAMATGMPLVLLAVAAVILQGVVLGRRGFAAGTGAPLRFRLGLVGKAGALAACLLLLALSAGVPLWVLLQRAHAVEPFRTAAVEMRSDILHSVVLAALAATAATAVGSIAGWLSVRVPRGAIIEILTIIPFAAPASVVGVGLQQLWNRPGWIGAFYVAGGVMVLAAFTRFIPFAVKPAAAAVRSTDPRLEEAAAVHGVPWWKAAAWIVAPLGARGFAAGWILVFVLSLGELDAAMLVSPAGIGTMPIRIFNAIHFGRTEVVSALCLILIFLSALPVLVYSLATARRMEVL